MSETLTVRTAEGEFSAYVARPASGAGAAPAAVVVLHEVFGVNADIRATCDELAEQGFIGVAPELFWRQERGVDLSVTAEPDWRKGLALYGAYDRDAGVGDVLATATAARALAGASGKVAVMGYCLGGLMTYLTAARGGAGAMDAGVAWHGGDTEKYLGEAGGVTAPLLMHLAGADEFIPQTAQEQIRAALGGKPNVTIHDYAGCHHAFSRHGGAHYDASAAALAKGRTWAFLGEQLG